MKKLILCIGLLATLRVQAVTTGVVLANGVFRFTFGAERASEGFVVSALDGLMR